MWHYVLLIVCAVTIYLSCEWFVNAVEWLGERLDVTAMAVGTILAAIGTALPESVVTLVAVTTGATDQAKDIGVGAAMGGPLALSTVAYGVTGAVLLIHRRRLRSAAVPTGTGTQTGTQTRPASDGTAGDALDNPAQLNRLAKDQAWFLPVFIVKVGLGLVAFAYKPVLGVVFFAIYAVYFWRELRQSPVDGSAEPSQQAHGELEPLRLQPGRPSPATWAVLLQTMVTLGVIFVASELFVRQLDAIGPMLGLSGSVTALLLSPIATELPEVMNAIIWVRQGKTRLALANISGAMMIQATVPSGLGLLFTSWKFDGPLLWSGAITIAAIGYLLFSLRTARLSAVRLALVAGFYLIFALGLIPLLA